MRRSSWRPHHALWSTLFPTGEFASARAHVEQRSPYDPQQHHTPYALLCGGHAIPVCAAYPSGPVSCGFLAILTRTYRACTRRSPSARELAHPHSLASALYFAAQLHQLRREGQAAPGAGRELEIALAGEQGSALELARGTILRGWALASQGQGAEWRRVPGPICLSGYPGAEINRTYFLALLAEGYRGTAEGCKRD